MHGEWPRLHAARARRSERGAGPWGLGVGEGSGNQHPAPYTRVLDAKGGTGKGRGLAWLLPAPPCYPCSLGRTTPKQHFPSLAVGPVLAAGWPPSTVITGLFWGVLAQSTPKIPVNWRCSGCQQCTDCSRVPFAWGKGAVFLGWRLLCIRLVDRFGFKGWLVVVTPLTCN